MHASRRDYLEVVRIVRRLERGQTRRLMWGHALADVFKKSNPRFDEKKFVHACGVEDDRVFEFAFEHGEK